MPVKASRCAPCISAAMNIDLKLKWYETDIIYEITNIYIYEKKMFESQKDCLIELILRPKQYEPHFWNGRKQFIPTILDCFYSTSHNNYLLPDFWTIFRRTPMSKILTDLYVFRKQLWNNGISTLYFAILTRSITPTQVHGRSIKSVSLRLTQLCLTFLRAAIF